MIKLPRVSKYYTYIVVLFLQEQYSWRRSSRELETTSVFFLILFFLSHTLTTRIEISLTPGIKTTDLYQKRHRLPNTWHGSTFTQRKFVRPIFVTEYRWKKFELTRLITIGITLYRLSRSFPHFIIKKN